MKSLLRKKPPADSQRTSQPAQAPARPPSNAAQAPPELPLYARFASSKQALSQQDDAGKTRPVVSGPMPLGKPGRIAVQLELDERRRRSESDNVDPRRKAGNARQEHLSKSQAAPATRPPSQTSVPQARQAKSPPQIQASERSTVPPTPATEQRAPLQARVSAADLQRKRDTLPPPPIPPFVSPSPYQLDAQAVSTPSRSNIPSVVSPRSIKTDLPALPTAASDRAPMIPNHSLPPTSGLAVSISTSNLSAPPPVLNYGKVRSHFICRPSRSIVKYRHRDTRSPALCTSLCVSSASR
ncbi:hypothetical protein BV25DRAFT_1271310 [Artomyces pyxidatus]|uniref:Uncharacterized protein n=1 Tax=Artomyces pyxidatus TaxID=48021 RepID=A0ACB8TF13_9AGAM|nr:hypothetical protein BV25DRAFT_1271310 [Artomyces pyxidatus]